MNFLQIISLISKRRATLKPVDQSPFINIDSRARIGYNQVGKCGKTIEKEEIYPFLILF